MRILLAILLCGSSPTWADNSELAIKIAICESGLRETVCNGRHCGIAQFREDTFYEFAAMAKLQNKHLGKPAWMNPIHQMYLLKWGLNHGYGNRWQCFRKIMRTREYAMLEGD